MELADLDAQRQIRTERLQISSTIDHLPQPQPCVDNLIGLICTPKTIRNRHKSRGLHDRIPAKKPELNKLTWNDVWSMPWNTQTDLLHTWTSYYFVMKKKYIHIFNWGNSDCKQGCGAPKMNGMISSLAFSWVCVTRHFITHPLVYWMYYVLIYLIIYLCILIYYFLFFIHHFTLPPSTTNSYATFPY